MTNSITTSDHKFFAMTLLMLATSVPDGMAQDMPDAPKDIGTITATDDAAGAVPQAGTAAYVAPSRAPLTAAQPTSVVGQHFIEKSIVPTQNTA